MLQPLHQPLKSPEDLAKMKVAGRLASEVLDFITPHVKPGITTGAPALKREGVSPVWSTLAVALPSEISKRTPDADV